MLEVKNLNVIMHTRYIIEGLSFNLGRNDKLAVIGEEGNGKSTLLKVIIGKCDYVRVEGSIDFGENRIGYLEQYMSTQELDKRVYDFLFAHDEDYYDSISELYKWLPTFGFDDAVLDRVIGTLSGGEKVKIGILKLLLEDADILFLDEPTNDLDIETLAWLEGFILNVEKPILYVSHDETLLAKTANIILHLEQLEEKTKCKYTLARTGYEEYVNMRRRALDKQTKLAGAERRAFDKKEEKLRRIMQEVDHQQSTISRGDPHGAALLKKKMRSLKAQERRLSQVILTERPEVEESIHFFFGDVSVPHGKDILRLIIPELKVANRVLSRNIELDVVGNEHVCIIGQNGCGKTTLIKHIYEELRSRDDIKVGYMPQAYEDIAMGHMKVLEFLAFSKQEDIARARTFLGSMNFTRDEMVTKIENLSDGTKAKLILVKLVLDGCNVLILDEPTRNVSPLSNPVIRRVLRDFKGAIISVSHDRKYIEEVVDTLYTLETDGLVRVYK